MSYSATQFAVTAQGDQYKFLFTDGRVFYTNRAEASFTLQTGTTFVEVEDSTGIHTVNFALCTSPSAVTFQAWVDAIVVLPTGSVVVAQQSFTDATVVTSPVLSSTGVLLTQDVAPSDTIRYRFMAINLFITGTATVLVEFSNDNTNWSPAIGRSMLMSPVFVSSISSTAVYLYQLYCRYVRVRVTSYGSGTIQAVAYFSQESYNDNQIQTTPVASTTLMGDVALQSRGNTTGSLSRAHIVSAASTNATSVKASAGRFHGFTLSNNNAAFRYVKLHNTAGVPTPGTGVVQTIGLPPNSTITQSREIGVGFSTGIGYSIVTGAADSDATAVGLNDVVGDLFYA